MVNKFGFVSIFMSKSTSSIERERVLRWVKVPTCRVDGEGRHERGDLMGILGMESGFSS